ncbi:MAG: hypothetical protein M5U09_12215 [Gammaproteobacteria bacterium]|nr:hypothetical protein [Gammaproteobacteria bacterium]
MARTQPAFRVTMSGVDKLMPDVDVLRVFESRLVHQLDRGRVIYCTQSALLYFWGGRGRPGAARDRGGAEVARAGLL